MVNIAHWFERLAAWWERRRVISVIERMRPANGDVLILYYAEDVSRERAFELYRALEQIHWGGARFLILPQTWKAQLDTTADALADIERAGLSPLVHGLGRDSEKAASAAGMTVTFRYPVIERDGRRYYEIADDTLIEEGDFKRQLHNYAFTIGDADGH